MEEVNIPPNKRADITVGKDRVQIADLDQVTRLELSDLFWGNFKFVRLAMNHVFKCFT